MKSDERPAIKTGEVNNLPRREFLKNIAGLSATGMAAGAVEASAPARRPASRGALRPTSRLTRPSRNEFMTWWGG